LAKVSTAWVCTWAEVFSTEIRIRGKEFAKRFEKDIKKQRIVQILLRMFLGFFGRE
jgi:hypothetical protein